MDTIEISLENTPSKKLNLDPNDNELVPELNSISDILLHP
jgi:hypothetical protein